VGADLRESLFGRLLGLGLPFHDRHRSGDLVTRLTGDVGRVEDSMVAWFTVLVPEALTLVGMVVVVLAVDLTLGLAALAVVPPLALVVAIRRRRIRVAQRASRDADAALASEATEVLRNVRVVPSPARASPVGASPGVAGTRCGRRWGRWTWRRGGRRWPTCCWRPGAGWCCGSG